jgi:hypothetical protein
MSDDIHKAIEGLEEYIKSPVHFCGSWGLPCPQCQAYAHLSTIKGWVEDCDRHTMDVVTEVHNCRAEIATLREALEAALMWW